MISKKEVLEQEKKSLSKSKEKSNFEKSKKISEQIEKISVEQKKSQKHIDHIVFNKYGKTSQKIIYAQIATWTVAKSISLA